MLGTERFGVRLPMRKYSGDKADSLSSELSPILPRLRRQFASRQRAVVFGLEPGGRKPSYVHAPPVAASG